MKNHTPSKQGFTLIEVFLALIIAVVGLSALLTAMIDSLAVVRTVRTQEVARSLLRRVNIENPIDEKKIAEGSDTGSFADVAGYTWWRYIEMVDEEERPGLFLVTTRVSWSHRNRIAASETVTYCYAPDSESVTKEF